MPSMAIAAAVESKSKPLARSKKIWIDLDNSPHVPFFRPILEELRNKGHDVFVTARDAYQVPELLKYYGVSAQLIGRHHGKHKLLKALGTCTRAVALAANVRKFRPDISVCHGSRGCLLASALLGIPNVTLIDYEFTQKIPAIRPTWLIVPSVLVTDELTFAGSIVLEYPGIKEDVYLQGFQPDQSLRQRLGISSDALLVTIRPPATEAHYHNPESEILFNEAVLRFLDIADARIVLLPRNKRQEAQLQSAWREVIASGKVVIPDHVEDGLNLIWNSDLVVSGGGTMNREAAAMGVPVYSIFRGTIGAVDRYLAEQGRLSLVQSVEEVQTKIKAIRREKSAKPLATDFPALAAIVQNLENILGGNHFPARLLQD